MMTAAEMENALCSVKRPRGQLKTRGLHLYDLLESKRNFKLPNARRQQIHKNAGSVGGDCNAVMALAMRGQGIGGKTIAKHFGINHFNVAQIFRSLGLSPLPNSRHLTLDEKAQRDYEEASIDSIRETQKDKTWARHPAYFAWYSMERYYQQNPERPVYLSDEERKKRARESARMSAKKQRQDPIFRMKSNLRKRLREKLKESSETNAVTGCTTIELRQWLESQFKGSMSWDNYGTAWHVDHIRPCASFDVSIKADRLAMNHYTNLQPMWAKTNLKKSDSWDGQYEFAHEIL